MSEDEEWKKHLTGDRISSVSYEVLRLAEEAQKHPSAFAEFVMRTERDFKNIVLSKHQRIMMDFLWEHPRSVVIIPIGHSKCVDGDTEIIDPRTGLLRRISDLVTDPTGTHVFTWSKENGIHAASITAKHDQGTKACLRITLNSGRSIVTTPEHPYLTPEGWARADSLVVGQSVGIANEVPHPEEPVRMNPVDVDLLAVILSNGCVVDSSMRFSTADPEIVRIMTEASTAHKCIVRQQSKYDYSIRGEVYGANPVRQLVRDMGLRGVKSKHKVIPPAIFQLSDEQLARFIAVFWMCDGTVGNGRNKLGPCMTLASEKMLRQFQHLLLRFGVQSSVHYRTARYERDGKEFDAWQLIVRSSSFENFSRAFAHEMWGEKAMKLECAVQRDRLVVGPVVSSTFVREVMRRIRAKNLTETEIKTRMGRPHWHNTVERLIFGAKRPDGSRKILPRFFSMVCTALDIREYDWLWDDTIWWDSVKSVESAGERHVYDLSMHPTACFLANDIIAHNTTLLISLILYRLGKLRRTRGAIISATQGQAKKVLSVCRGYITHPSYQLVWPGIMPSKTRAWTESEITIERPEGIKDPSLAAYGIDSGSILGSRLDFIAVDDILNRQNTATKEQRDKTYEFFDSMVSSRLEPDAQIIVSNSAWHQDDMLHRLERLGWPVLRMQINGDVYIKDGAVTTYGKNVEPWDHALLVPTEKDAADVSFGERCRIEGHKEDDVLWPERFPDGPGLLARLRERHPITSEFNRLFMSMCRDDGEAMCKSEWIEKCKLAAREMGVHELTQTRIGGDTYTGVDLAFSKSDSADYSALFTMEVMPSGHRKILDIQRGRWSASELKDRILDTHARYESILRVENNACFEQGTNVLTKTGYRPIESLAVGDEVWTHKGRWRKVLDVLSGRSLNGTLRVRTCGGIAVKTTYNHWFHMRPAGRTPGRKGGHHRPIGSPKWASIGLIDQAAYIETAVPKWEPIEPVLHTHDLRRGTKAYQVDEGMAMLLGLLMADGCVTGPYIHFSLGTHEQYLIQFAKEQLARVGAKPNVYVYGSVTRVTASHAGLARVLKFGTEEHKCVPLAWMGWPLDIRVAVVRGWLLGDGCVLDNNKANARKAKSESWVKRFLSGVSISRDWMLWARTTLLEAGYRPTLVHDRKPSTAMIDGRTCPTKLLYKLALNHEDSFRLLEHVQTPVERARWGAIQYFGRRSNATIAQDEHGVWSRIDSKCPAETRAPYDGVVYNLVVEEDESYVVEDMLVHNAQTLLVDLLAQENKGLPIKGHTTGQNKANISTGVHSVFNDMAHGLWLIPNDEQGRVHPNVQVWIDECLYYTPDKHSGDVLMASWFCREQARLFGALRPKDKRAQQDEGLNLMAR